jgi:hypothetical protein
MVVPNGRAKLSAHDDITSEVELCVALPGGGEITARGELHSRVHGVVFLPSGHGKLQAAAPINTIVRLKEIALPHSQGALTVDIGLEGAAELTMEMPGHNAQLRLHFGATLPLAPLVRLVRHEVERHVRVEYFEVGPPWLAGAHDLVVPLYVEARKGVLAKVEIIAQFHIDPRSKLVELRSVQAHGLNAAGRAAAGLYLNRKVFKSMRRTRLFDPFTMLPPQARIDALAVKAASADAIVIEGDMTFDSARPSQDIAN